MAGMPAPGWYPDPDGSRRLRYFDGRAWTPQTAEPPAASGPSGVPGHGGPPQSGYAQYGGGPSGAVPPGYRAPVAKGGTSPWLWVVLALALALIVGMASWLLFFRQAPAPTPQPTPNVAPSAEQSIPDSGSSEDPPASSIPPADRLELPAVGAQIEPVAGCPGTAADAIGQPDPDGRITSAAELSIPAAPGFLPASIQFPWVHGSNTQARPYADGQLAFMTVGTVLAEAGYVETTATAMATAACLMGSGVYESETVTGTILRAQRGEDHDEVQLLMDVDLVGPGGPTKQFLYVMALKDADVMHVLISTVPRDDPEARDAMELTSENVRLR